MWIAKTCMHAIETNQDKDNKTDSPHIFDLLRQETRHLLAVLPQFLQEFKTGWDVAADADTDANAPIFLDKPFCKPSTIPSLGASSTPPPSTPSSAPPSAPSQTNHDKTINVFAKHLTLPPGFCKQTTTASSPTKDAMQVDDECQQCQQ